MCVLSQRDGDLAEPGGVQEGVGQIQHQQQLAFAAHPYQPLCPTFTLCPHHGLQQDPDDCFWNCAMQDIQPLREGKKGRTTTSNTVIFSGKCIVHQDIQEE